MLGFVLRFAMSECRCTMHADIILFSRSSICMHAVIILFSRCSTRMHAVIILFSQSDLQAILCIGMQALGHWVTG